MAEDTREEQQQDDVDDVDDVDENTDTPDDSDDDDNAAPEVTFKTKADFTKHVNGIVQKRLKRETAKYEPIVKERDTLKERVGQLSGADKDKSQADQQIAALTKQVETLLEYQRNTQRNELVRNIAKDRGLPDEFIARVQGDDEDSITEDVDELVALLNVDAKPAPKRTPKTTKPAPKDAKGGKGSDGKGGADDDDKNDPVAIAKAVGRYGRRGLMVTG